MKKILVSGLFIILVLLGMLAGGLAGVVVAGDFPRVLEEIPIFPGAQRDSTAEEEYFSLYGEWSGEAEDGLGTETVRIYSTEAVPEEVGKFYIKSLNAIERMPVDPGPMGPGTVIEPRYDLYFYQEDDFEDQYIDGARTYDGGWVKSCLSGRRTWDNGEWLKAAGFLWMVVLEDGERREYSIDIEDASFDLFSRDYRAKTLITLRLYTEKSEEAYLEEMDQSMDDRATEISLELSNNPPTAETLGVPLYPGAELDIMNSAGMSLDGDYRCYIYLSGDSTDRVVEFYEKALGKEAAPGGMGYILPLTGELPFPDEAITIQPNMFGGEAKTVITIQKVY